MKPAWPAAALGLSVLAACAKSEPTETFPNEQIVAELNKRLGAHPCCDDAGQPTTAERQLFVLVRREVRGEQVVCGWSGFAPIRHKDGTRLVPPATSFVVREKTLFIERDLGAGQFNYWQDSLCGPDWVKQLGR